MYPNYISLLAQKYPKILSPKYFQVYVLERTHFSTVRKHTQVGYLCAEFDVCNCLILFREFLAHPFYAILLVCLITQLHRVFTVSTAAWSGRQHHVRITMYFSDICCRTIGSCTHGEHQSITLNRKRKSTEEA